MGTPDFSVPILDKLIRSTNYDVVLVVTQPDRPRGRKRELTPPPVKQAAMKYDIPVFQPEKIAADFDTILSYKPDIIVTAAYGQLLPSELLDTPPYGCINVHASLLPELRGGAPIHFAILKGFKETGITIMYMIERLDAGDILTQASIPIEHKDDVGTLHNKLSQLGSDLLMETLPSLFRRELTPIKQVESEATFAPNITREMEKINWSKSNEEVYNHIRGLRPWPVAYTTYNGERMKIWHAEMDEQAYAGKPGEIVKIENNESFIVVCGNGSGIKIMEIQPAGSKKMSVAEYLRGSPDRIKTGVIMGE